jgi:hypothetical protein
MSVQDRISTKANVPPVFRLLAAGTYDLVAIDPNNSRMAATRIVALAADAGWTLTDSAGTSTGPIAVPVNFDHKGHTQAITCASPIAVYWE